MAERFAVHDLGDVNLSRVHMTVPSTFRKKAKGIMLHSGELPGEDVEGREGFSVTAPMRSILDTAAASIEVDG